MKKSNTSEIISCPNHEWRLFKRGQTYYADGRKHKNGKHSLAVNNRKDAIRALYSLDEVIAQQSNGNQEATAATMPKKESESYQPIAIDDGWQLYLDRRRIPIHLGGLKPSSVRKYKSHKKRFVAYCNKNEIKCWSTVDRELLESYAKALDEILAPVTIHDDLTMEISVSNWLIKNKLISFDSKISWKLQKPPGAEQYCYQRDEVKRMLELSLTNKRFRWLYRLIFLLSHTGMRIGEAINLKWSDIDLIHGVVHVRDDTFKKKVSGQERRLVKAKKSRIIPIHEALMQCIKECDRDSDYFLAGQDGRKRSYSHSLDPFKDHVIKPLMKEFPTPKGELGFKDGRFHSFRHFFVSECFDAGIPECDIKDWVGHSDSKIVALYRHIRSETAKANMRLGNFGAK